MHEANGAGCRQRGDSPTQARLWEPRRSQSPSVAPSSSSRSGSHNGATRITPCTRTKPMSCSRTEDNATMAWYVGSPSIKVETRIALTASVERMSRNRLCQAGTTRPCTAIWAVDALPPGYSLRTAAHLTPHLGTPGQADHPAMGWVGQDIGPKRLGEPCTTGRGRDSQGHRWGRPPGDTRHRLTGREGWEGNGFGLIVSKFQQR